MGSYLSDDFINAAYTLEKSKILDWQMQAKSVAVGNLTEDQVSSVLSVAQADLLQKRNAENTNKDSATKDALLFALIQQINDLNQDIEHMEAAFTAKYGDAWREELALKILDEDMIPERKQGETIEAYRERLEELLVDELLNDDGSIKDQYKNDPELKDYAQWAQKIYNRDAAQVIANDLKKPAITAAQTQVLLEKMEEAANSEQNIFTARALEGHETQKTAVLDVDDQLHDEKFQNDRSNFTQDFLKPIG
ncbi:MAG: hypothetical protein ACRBBR_06560 [Cellvibrionaceae bacterium]